MCECDVTPYCCTYRADDRGERPCTCQRILYLPIASRLLFSVDVPTLGADDRDREFTALFCSNTASTDCPFSRVLYLNYDLSFFCVLVRMQSLRRVIYGHKRDEQQISDIRSG